MEPPVEVLAPPVAVVPPVGLPVSPPLEVPPEPGLLTPPVDEGGGGGGEFVESELHAAKARANQTPRVETWMVFIWFYSVLPEVKVDDQLVQREGSLMKPHLRDLVASRRLGG